jgi:DNA polymerase III subunit beta
MKATFKQENLKKALNLVAGIIPRTPIAPTSAYVKIEAADKGLRLVGTDQEVSIRVKLPHEGLSSPEDILLPADKLRLMVSESDAETVSIETEGTIAKIVAGRSRFTLHGLEGTEFPEVPVCKGVEMVTLAASDLADAIAQTQFAISREPSRFAINGVHVQIEDKTIEFAATDGKRLANSIRKLKGKKAAKAAAIVPPKMIAEMRRLCEGLGDADVQIGVSEKNIALVAGDSEVISLLVEGTFPKYKDVIPTDCDKEVIIDRAALAAKLREAAVLTSDDTRSVTISIGKNLLVMESRIPEVGDAKIEMDAQYSGEPISLAFDNHFFREVLDVLKGDAIKLEVKDATRPGVIREGKEFIYVMMPMKVKD